MTDNTELEYRQAIVYAEELRELYQSEKMRADELEAAKRQLETTLQKLVEAERQRGEFIDNCSHELRTPLAPIIGWADVMRTRDISQEEMKEFAEVISRQGRRLLEIVNSLLAIAGVDQTADRNTETGPVDLRGLIEEITTVAHEVGRTVEITIQEGASTATLNEESVKEILGYLINNALKFSPAGTPLEVTTERRAAGIVISVIDHGPGIAEEDRERIFEAFVQGDGSSTRTHGGIGAGLYIAKELAKAQGGSLWMEETAGGGATFRLGLRQAPSTDPSFIHLGVPSDPP